MEYKICFLHFQNGINISSVLALCKSSSIQLLEKIVVYKKQFDKYLSFELSDFMPYDNEQLFVNRPTYVAGKIDTLGFVNQKALRTLDYIGVNEIRNYYNGNFDYLSSSKRIFGTLSNRDRNSTFTFKKNSGIYCIVGSERKTINTVVTDLKKMIIDIVPNIVEIKMVDLSENYLKVIKTHEKYILVLSSLNTRLPETILNLLCNESSYTISENMFLNKKTCFINPGACILEAGVQSYNSIISEYGLPKCVSISLELQGANNK